jgi:hypothetical protein
VIVLRFAITDTFPTGFTFNTPPEFDVINWSTTLEYRDSGTFYTMPVLTVESQSAIPRNAMPVIYDDTGGLDLTKPRYIFAGGKHRDDNFNEDTKHYTYTYYSLEKLVDKALSNEFFTTDERTLNELVEDGDLNLQDGSGNWLYTEFDSELGDAPFHIIKTYNWLDDDLDGTPTANRQTFAVMVSWNGLLKSLLKYVVGKYDTQYGDGLIFDTQYLDIYPHRILSNPETYGKDWDQISTWANNEPAADLSLPQMTASAWFTMFRNMFNFQILLTPTLFFGVVDPNPPYGTTYSLGSMDFKLLPNLSNFYFPSKEVSVPTIINEFKRQSIYTTLENRDATNWKQTSSSFDTPFGFADLSGWGEYSWKDNDGEEYEFGIGLEEDYKNSGNTRHLNVPFWYNGYRWKDKISGSSTENEDHVTYNFTRRAGLTQPQFIPTTMDDGGAGNGDYLLLVHDFFGGNKIWTAFSSFWTNTGTNFPGLTTQEAQSMMHVNRLHNRNPDDWGIRYDEVWANGDAGYEYETAKIFKPVLKNNNLTDADGNYYKYKLQFDAPLDVFYYPMDNFVFEGQRFNITSVKFDTKKDKLSIIAYAVGEAYLIRTASEMPTDLDQAEIEDMFFYSSYPHTWHPPGVLGASPFSNMPDKNQAWDDNGGSISVDIEDDSAWNWKAEGFNGVTNVSPTAGTGDQACTYDMPYNYLPASVEREVKFYGFFWNAYFATKTVTITQGSNPQLFAMAAVPDFTDGGGTIQHTVQCTVPHEFTGMPAWLTLDPYRKLEHDTYDMEITAAENLADESRTAYITVTFESPGMSDQIITITQLGKNP